MLLSLFTALAIEHTATEPITDLTLHQGKPAWLTASGRYVDGARAGDGGHHFAPGPKGWSVASIGYRSSLDGTSLGSMITLYDLAGDGTDVVAVGLDNNAPSGQTHGWVQVQGAHTWTAQARGDGYAHFTGVLLTADRVVALGSSDHGRRSYAPWFVVFDRASGAQQLEVYGSLPGWSALVDVVPASDGSFTAVGHTSPHQPAAMPSATPWVWTISADGEASDPVVLKSEVLVNVEAAASDGEHLWLVATALAPGATVREGPYLGALGRSDGREVVWKALPDCRAATQIEVDGHTLWLAGHDGRRKTGWVASYAAKDFESLAPVTSCNDHK